MVLYAHSAQICQSLQNSTVCSAYLSQSQMLTCRVETSAGLVVNHSMPCSFLGCAENVQTLHRRTGGSGDLQPGGRPTPTARYRCPTTASAKALNQKRQSLHCWATLCSLAARQSPSLVCCPLVRRSVCELHAVATTDALGRCAVSWHV